MEELRVLFTIPEQFQNEREHSETMLQAFELCKQHVSNVNWIRENELENTDLSKTDFIVFQTFEGRYFESLKSNKCVRMLGPWCILVCLGDGKRIPNFTWPIYNVAMVDCVITCSHLSKQQKNEIKEKVQLMGGFYSDNLMDTTTHLVTGSVKSVKYLQAAEANINIMLPKWIEDVWEQSQTGKIHCTDEQFNKHKCPVFYNLTICCTGITEDRQRKELVEIINTNGGIYSGSLNVKSTDVLIVCGEQGSTSAKYKAARRSNNVDCVTYEWIMDSVKKGYALPSTAYHVKTVTSTPTKDDGIHPNFSLMSVIGGLSSTKTIFEQTTLNETVKTAEKKRLLMDLENVINTFDMKKVKNAGHFLDGCSVYLIGFESSQKEKLSKILNMSGATRYEDVSDRLTHVIVGDINCPEVKSIKTKTHPFVMVTLQWLLESMKLKQPANEENFLVSESQDGLNSSPVCHKALNLLRSNKTIREENANEKTITNNETNIDGHDNSLVQQYLKSASLQNDEERDTLAALLQQDPNFNEEESSKLTLASVTSATTSDAVPRIFDGLKFMINDFDSENYDNLKELIENAKGTVTSKSFKGIPDVLVVPRFTNSVNQLTAKEIVNEYWIQECCQEMEYKPILYYHQPMVLPNSSPLINCVITISSYKNYERHFLSTLIVALGGISQDQFSRVTSNKKNVLGSTHLISSETAGKKYTAALKWGLPVVDKDWLLECAKTGTLVNEDAYLIGESKSGKTNEKIRQTLNSITSSLGQSTPNETTNKRMKLLISESSRECTPNTNKTETPINQINFITGATPKHLEGNNPCSQVTPVSKIMENARLYLSNTSETPSTKKHWTNLDTPKTPYGAVLKSNPSPNTRKEWLYYIEHIPDLRLKNQERRLSTPLSELKRRYYKSILDKKNNENEGKDVAASIDEDEASPQRDECAAYTKLKEIENMLSSTSRKRKSSGINVQIPDNLSTTSKDSMPMTVGWDFEDMATPIKLKVFMISGVNNELRQELVNKLENLHCIVSDLSSYDPNSTHLICPQPGRNEKTLSCMASGKWILHINYVFKSAEAGELLDEEEFEFGNPKAVDNIPKENFNVDYEMKNQCIYWWRKEINRRGYGAFNDMRAIVVAQKRENIVRVIEAGGGKVLDVRPPFDESVHATHCLLEIRSITNYDDYLPLVQKGILCLNTIYVSDFLHKADKDIYYYILPAFTKFYKKDQ